MSFSVRGNFFCIFKTGDNIQSNLATLRFLYEVYKSASDEDKSKLLKPIIIIKITIIEAILHDFHLRIRANRNEGVVGMSQDELDYIRNKQIDEFKKYIDSAKKHDFFNEANSNMYDKLDELRVVRNRIHIQNAKFLEPRDDSAVFTLAAKRSAERCLERVVKTVSQNHARPSYLADYVGDLVFPWDEHFD